MIKTRLRNCSSPCVVTKFKIPRPFHEVKGYYEKVFVYHHISNHVGEHICKWS